METKPYRIQSPEDIAKDYGGNKQKIAEAMQMGVVDPTAGVLAGMFLKDAIVALESNSNAIGWYNRTVGRALDVLQLIHPELATDPDAATAFKFILAVTSNGMRVNRNFQLAERAYRDYKKTGKFSEKIGEGKQGSAMNAHAKQFK